MTLTNTTRTLVKLGYDAELAGMRVVRVHIPGRNDIIDIQHGPGLDTEGQPLWGARIFLTERNTFLAAKYFVGPHITSVHTIGEIRRLLFEE